MLGKTLSVHAAIDGGESVSIAGIPYQHAGAVLEYRGETHSLTVSQLELARQDAGNGYRLSLAEPATLNLDSHEIDLHAILQGARLQENGPFPSCDLARLRQAPVDHGYRYTR